jgi:2-succinyl-5-enolpyruvyl-6-hydroxy-3-cyclohexene-1-carboxylate synthase
MPEAAGGHGDVDVALVAFEATSALVDEFARAGVGDACISPGSRSTALALALARHGGLRTRVHLDERSSAFVALGVAKATGRPAVVVTTSGTAVANLLPAVVEAAMSRTPLILLTADRPPELRGVGANQTIDQIGIFGAYARWFADAPVPSGADGDAGRWRALALRAFAEAVGPPAGPVHVNLPFREPLVPPPTARGVADGADTRVVRDPAAGDPRTDPPIDPRIVDQFAAGAAGTERGLILAGWLEPWTADEDLRAIEALAAATGWPLLAEPLSGLRRPPAAMSAGQLLFMDEAFAAAHAPDIVLQLGAAPTTRAAQAMAARAGRLIVAAAGPADPGRRADPALVANPGEFARECAGALPARRFAETSWASEWREADVAARGAADAVLDRLDAPFEGRVARDLAAGSPHGSFLFAGSSMPVRDLDAFMAPRAGLRVIANRGASGIDGSVSTALGVAAAAWAGEPVLALIGDLALLHDAGALLWSGRAARSGAGESAAREASGDGANLVLVVPNNGGGGIFDHLSVASEPEHDRLFVTPHAISLEAIADAAGAAYHRVEIPEELAPAASAAARDGGVHLIEVPIDRAAGRRAREAVRASVADALTSL